MTTPHDGYQPAGRENVWKDQLARNSSEKVFLMSSQLSDQGAAQLG